MVRSRIKHDVEKGFRIGGIKWNERKEVIRIILVVSSKR